MLSEPLGDAVMQRHREPGAVEVAGEDVGVAAQLGDVAVGVGDVGAAQSASWPDRFARVSGDVAVAGRVQNLLDKADLIGI